MNNKTDKEIKEMKEEFEKALNGETYKKENKTDKKIDKDIEKEIDEVLGI